MAKLRHGPRGICGCCNSPCFIICPDGESQANVVEVEWDITFPNELTIWYFNNNPFFSGWVKQVYSGLSVLNGTYVVTMDPVTCYWSVYRGSEQITATWYSYNNELLVDSGGEEYNCPDLSGYVGEASVYDFNVSIFANPYSIQFTGPFNVYIDGYGKGPNNNSPCESATINWNTLDNYPVDTRCSGISNQVVTAVLTPTII